MKYILALFVFLLGLPADAASPPPQLLRFRPIIVSTYNNTQISGYLSITLTVETSDRDALDRLEAARPKLQDAFTRAAIDLGQLYVSPNKRLDFPLLVRRLQAAANAALPQEKIRVYIVDAITRRV